MCGGYGYEDGGDARPGSGYTSRWSCGFAQRYGDATYGGDAAGYGGCGGRGRCLWRRSDGEPVGGAGGGDFLGRGGAVFGLPGHGGPYFDQRLDGSWRRGELRRAHTL